MGPAVGHLIGLSGLEWTETTEIRTKPAEQLRYLKAELGSDFDARRFAVQGPISGHLEDGHEASESEGLMRRLIRAVAAVF